VPLLVNQRSYSDVRRSINGGLLPPRESVRIEEMINHFPYEYPQPSANESFPLNLDVVTCPWEPTHRLVRIGLNVQQAMNVRADSGIEVEFNPKRVTSYRLTGYDRQETETPGSNETTAGLIQRTVSDTGFDFAAAPSDLKFAAAVAEFGMILRGSEYKGSGSLQQVLEWAQQGRGADVNGYRADFIELVRKTQVLKKS
jgi:hypothetical protein